MEIAWPDVSGRGSLGNVLEVLDEKYPVKQPTLAMIMVDCTREEFILQLQRDVAAGGAEKSNLHIPICFGGELPAHSQDKSGPARKED